MIVSSRMPEGTPNDCPVCRKTLWIEPSHPTLDAPCPHCGSLLWFPRSIIGGALDSPDSDVVIALSATSKEEAIDEILLALARRNSIDRRSTRQITKAILHREDLGSTAVGRGFAIPHVKHESVDRLVVALATSEDGIDYNSLDGRPVHTLFLMISPADRPGDHLWAMERLSRFIRSQPS